jgi:hypothetical protein
LPSAGPENIGTPNLAYAAQYLACAPHLRPSSSSRSSHQQFTRRQPSYERGGAPRRLFVPYLNVVSARELLRHTLDDKHTRLGCFDAGCVNLLLGGGIVPGLCFLGAIEGNHDETLRRSSIECGYLVSAHNVATAKVLKNGRGGLIGSLAQGFEALWISYLCNVNDSVSARRLTLRTQSIDRRGSDCDARKHCQPQCDKPIHGTLLWIRSRRKQRRKRALISPALKAASSLIACELMVSVIAMV